MAMLLKGAPVAAAMTEELIARREALESRGVVPTLCILRVGDRPGDLVYQRNAVKRCEKIGIRVLEENLPQDCGQQDLLDVIRRVNEDDSIHGLLLMRPLPRKEDEEAARALLRAEKDMDGFTMGAQAAVFTGEGEGYPPCTAQAVMEILDHYEIDPAGCRAAVVGRSLVIGRPVAMMLMERDATVTICHSRTKDLAQICQQAKILVAAAGRAGLVDEACAAPDQVVIDVGINVDEQGNLRGDADFEAMEPLVSAITPVPGGVGGVTTAVLAQHVIRAAERAAGDK